ncbi:conserved exported hypothetical protein [Novosphingobium sp. 9U]|nr:conserved exported hypothetical protein [Novosphingobium sp. 9U]
MQRTLSFMSAAAVTLGATLTMPAQASPRTATAVAVVQAQVDAFNKGDVNAFASLYADNVEIFDLGSDAKPSLSGRGALIARYEPMLSRYHPRATVLSRVEAGAFVIDKERTEAGGRASEGVAIYQVESGKIRRVWFAP